MQEVQKQKGTKDCGVFVIAFLTSLAYNQDPADGPIQFNQEVICVTAWLEENLYHFLHAPDLAYEYS